MKSIRLGVDFDNTLVLFDQVFYRYAVRLKLISKNCPADKNSIRTEIRRRHGNDRWTYLQSVVYSEGLKDAPMAPDAREVLARLKKEDAEIFIVSHKTPRAAAPENPADLIGPATTWLKRHGFSRHVYFEKTREAKLRRIQDLRCTHFIDDLEEVFLERTFPAQTFGIHLGQSRAIGHLKKNIFSFDSWRKIGRFLEASAEGGALPPETKDFLLKNHVVPVSLEVLEGGRNHRGYAVRDESGRQYFLKVYRQKSGDTANRLETEFRSLSWLWKRGIRQIARPYAYDRKAGIGLYGYLPGRVLGAKEIRRRHLFEVVRFVGRLKKLSKHPSASSFAPAREACFSIQAYWDNLEERLARLKRVPDRTLRNFLNKDVAPIMTRIRCHVDGLGRSKVSEKILSPSDVGFHNILSTEKPFKLFFVDFEYFGSDDPAKMLCDFILQPDRPIPQGEVSFFMQEFTDLFDRKTREDILERFTVICPILWLKWVFIILNPYLAKSHKGVELQKAGRMLLGLGKALKRGIA